LNNAITNELLRTLSDVLAAPICALLNTSIRSGYVPNQWKISRVTLVPKVTPVTKIESDIRPISITCPVSSVAESFIARYFDQHFDQYLDHNQFGASRNRSTVLALTKLCRILFEAADDCGNFIRLVFVDFTKAFDLIDHSVLYKKFVDCEFPTWLTAWSLSFLKDRMQFVKVRDIMSGCLVTNAGAPQGTRAGSGDFKLLINDLRCNEHSIKYVGLDDVSMASVSDDPLNDVMQTSINQLEQWSQCNAMRLNNKKTKEMILHFGRRFDIDAIPNLVVSGSNIERVKEFKLLGVIVRSDLNWTSHVKYMVSKASKRIFVILYPSKKWYTCS